MDYQYKVIISNRGIYKEFEITSDMQNVCLGTTSKCEFRLNQDLFFDKIELTLTKVNKKWQVFCGDSVYLSNGDVRKLMFVELSHGDILCLRYAESGNEVFELRFIIDFEARIPYYNWYVNLDSISEINIGDNQKSNLVIKSKFSDNNEIKIKSEKNKVYIQEIESKYGVFINGKRISEITEINDYDFIFIAEFSFYYKEKNIYFDKIGIDSCNLEIYQIQVENSFKYPAFVRNTRTKLQLDSTPIKILDPSSKPTKPELNIITSLMPALAMFALVVVMRGIMSTTGGAYILFSICSMGMGIVTTIIGLVQGRRKYKKEIKERKKVYNLYIENKKKEIQVARDEEIDKLNKTYYRPQIGLEKIQKFDSDIFDRIPEDNDFLDVYLGIGRKLSLKQIDYKAQEKLSEEDDLSLIPSEIYEEFKYVEGVPIIMELRNANAVGISGNSEYLYAMFKNILADIVCRQYYGDVKVYLLIDENVKKYEWVKLLPHINTDIKVRNIVFDNKSKTNIFESLYKELTYRLENEGEFQHLVILVMDENGITSHPISKFIEKASDVNVSFIFFEKNVDCLPLHCSNIIELNDIGTGLIYLSSDKSKSQTFKYEEMTDYQMESLVHKIAPIYCEEISLESSLRKNFSMFEMLGIYVPNDLNLERCWNESKIYDSFAVPLGINSKDEIVYLNLHEKAHGPHGLVAGTTGSGKSEILQSYILSAATLFHPYEIGFVIIDFKGGGMVNQFSNLPHLIGAITNIDGKEIDRSLKSIKAELIKRQTLFSEAGVNHIDKYIKEYKEGKLTTALPHLVIIVDEFAELKAEQPEFMKELISAARIGRSLGVHLILATQKPAGQVNEQIWSNSKFKLCLKVQDQEDSKEVLKSPLAAEIKEPGRAYLQVGNNEIFELFQSAYSGGLAVREDESSKKKFTIYKMGLEGYKGVLFEKKKSLDNDNKKTELESIVEYVSEFCKDKGIDRLPSICLPSLKEIINYEDINNLSDKIIEVPIGIYDDPDHQYQGILNIDIGRENSLIVGTSQIGKTNLLQLCIRHLSSHNSPEEVVFYILDFGSMVLKNFESLCHVGGVVLASEDEKVKNLFKLLLDEMDKRKNKLMNVGVSSYQSYKEAGLKDMTKIYVMLDNFNAFKELYMDKYEQTFVRICRDGISLGISVIITNVSTTGIGYRHMSNFSNKICFTCNESSDYSSLLDRCRMEPKNIPGRILIQKNKEIYEAQTYLAFEGEKEINRVDSMRDFVIKTNEKYTDFIEARRIPGIPDKLYRKDFDKQFGYEIETTMIPFGLDFTNIEPVLIDTSEECEFAIISKKKDKSTDFIIELLKNVQNMSLKSRWNLYIVDSLERKLLKFKESPLTNKYTIDISEVEIILEKVLITLQSNKEIILNNGISSQIEQNIIILNSKEVLEYISTTKPVLEIFKKIVNDYKNYGILFIYGCVENVSVPYSAPELLKRIKESRKAIILDNLSTLKIFEITSGIIRSYSKPLMSDEGYWLNGTEITKVKLFSEEAY